ncbi:MAG: VTT domain-containing protein [Clostridiales bacterium]|nr:VTT domain-containing protein [Clostridiales bacterium]
MNKWIKLLLIISSFAIVSIILYFVLRAFGITKISTIRKIVESTGNMGLIVYTIIQSVLLVVLCFVPLLNTSLVFLGIVLFGSKWAFITCLISVFISASTLFFIGDKFGEKLAVKFLGKETFEETQNLLETKSKIYLFVFYMIPIIPDEALGIMSGMTKIKYWYFILVCMLFHTIEFTIFCFFGSELINWGSLSVIEWIIFINVLIIDYYFLLKFEKYLEKRIKK